MSVKPFEKDGAGPLRAGIPPAQKVGGVLTQKMLAGTSPTLR